MKKKIVVIAGAPATGKTTLWRELASSLDVPFLSKDEFKELLFDELGVRNRKWSDQLGRTSFELMWQMADILLRANDSLIVETAFSAEFSTPRLVDIVRRHNAEVLHFHLECSTKQRLHRIDHRVSRGLRHRGHYDAADRIKTKIGKHLPESWIAQPYPAMPLPFPLHKVNTEEFSSESYASIETKVREFLRY